LIEKVQEVITTSFIIIIIIWFISGTCPYTLKAYRSKINV